MFRIAKLSPRAQLALARKCLETGMSEDQYLEAFLDEHLGRHCIESESIHYLKNMDLSQFGFLPKLKRG